jgi:hypothetical protein
LNRNQENIENQFRSAFEAYEPPLRPDDWQRIASRLRESKRRRGFILWWSSGFVLLLLLLGVILYSTDDGTFARSEKLELQTPVQVPANGQDQQRGTLQGDQTTQIAHAGSGRINRNVAEGSGTDPRSETAVKPGGNTEGESHENSGPGSSHAGRDSEPNANEGTESGADLPHLPGRRISLNIPIEPLSEVSRLVWPSAKPAVYSWRRFTTPALMVQGGLGWAGLAAPSANLDGDWQGKTVSRTSAQPALIARSLVGIQMPLGSWYLQTGAGFEQSLNSQKQRWAFRTRLVADSFPYRNVPGDTLFWVPVRFTDTILQVETEYKESRWVIPVHFTKLLRLNPRYGMVFQGGAQLARITRYSGSVLSPYTDRTFTQMQADPTQRDKGGPAPVVPIGTGVINRWQTALQGGAGAYWWLNEHIMLQGTYIMTGAVQMHRIENYPLQQRQLGGHVQIQMLFKW